MRALLCTVLAGVFIGFWLDCGASTLTVPSPYPTIQSAIIAASPDDTVLVGPGLYDENLDTLGKRLLLIGEAGAQATVVDGGRRDAVLLLSGGGVVEGFTLQGGQSFGGGLRVVGPASAEIRNNIIKNNIAGRFFDSGLGGGVYFGAQTTGNIFEFNTVRDNFAGDSGGGIYDVGNNVLRNNIISGNGCHVCGGGLLGGIVVTENLIINNWADSFGAGICVIATSRIENNTIVGNFNRNNFVAGAGIFVSGGSFTTVTISRNVIVGNGGTGGSGVGLECSTSGFLATSTIECNDSWGNDYADYLFFGICDTTGGKNFSLDPQFCGEDMDDFQIAVESPCAPDFSNGCGLVGAFTVGCGGVQTTPTTWGKLKARYR